MTDALRRSPAKCTPASHRAQPDCTPGSTSYRICRTAPGTVVKTSDSMRIPVGTFVCTCTKRRRLSWEAILTRTLPKVARPCSFLVSALLNARLTIEYSNRRKRSQRAKSRQTSTNALESWPCRPRLPYASIDSLVFKCACRHNCFQRLDSHLPAIRCIVPQCPPSRSSISSNKNGIIFCREHPCIKHLTHCHTQG